MSAGNVTLTREQLQQAVYALDRRIVFILETLPVAGGDYAACKAEHDAAWTARALLSQALALMP